MANECYVYIMASRSLTLYIGMTNHMQRRAREHKAGETNGFSKQYRCDRLVFYEAFPGPLQAIAREKQFEGLETGEEDRAYSREESDVD